jgi:acetyl esterase/lipase
VGCKRLGVLLAALSVSACTQVYGASLPNTGGAAATPVQVAPFPDLAVLQGQPACPASGTLEDIYYPAWEGAPAPVVVFIHGGSWMLGSRTNVTSAEPLLSTLRGRGYAVVSVDYRLAPAYRWPAMLDDSRCALEHLRATAPQLGLDASRIALVGYSAGAQLALLLALDSPGSPRPAAVVELAGPVDLDQPDYVRGQVEMIGREVFGVTDPAAPLLREASPLAHVRGGDPPVLILHGTDDEAVPFAQSVELAAAMRRVGDTVALVPVSGADHSLLPVAGLRPELWDFLARYVSPRRRSAAVQ